MQDKNKKASERIKTAKFKIGDRVLNKRGIKFGTIDNVKEYCKLGTKDVSLVLYDVEYDNGYVEHDVRESELAIDAPIRWRANLGENYYCINYVIGARKFKAWKEDEDAYYIDQARFELGNYFRTEKQAQEAFRRIKQTLNDYHKEIGE